MGFLSEPQCLKLGSRSTLACQNKDPDTAARATQAAVPTNIMPGLCAEVAKKSHK